MKITNYKMPKKKEIYTIDQLLDKGRQLIGGGYFELGLGLNYGY